MFALMDNYYKDIDNRVYNVGIYLRLSREDESSIQSESILNQKEYITRFVLEQEWNIVDIYTDDGYTGTNFDRPDFKRMLNDIENKRINLVITKDLSRLGRDYIDTGYYLERYFPENNIRYIALNDGIDTFMDNSSNNDMSPFKSVMNDMYAKDISKKVRTTMNSKRKNGEFIGSFAPYGYKKSPENKNKLIIDEEVAFVVRRIFQMYVGGNGYAHIAHVLNEEGVLSPVLYKAQNCNYKNPKTKVKLWTQETIRRIITNPTYAGNVTQNRCSKINYKLKKLKLVPREYWVIVENTHEPIIEKDVFEFAQQLMEKKASVEYTSKKSVHLLAGLIFCGDCGERMTFTKTQKGEMYCICSKYKRFKRCTRHSILESELEKLILNDLKKIAQYAVNKENLLEIAKKKTEKSEENKTDKTIKEIENRLAEIKRAIKSLYEDKLKGLLTEQDFMDLSQDYNKERERLVLRLSSLNDKRPKVGQKENRTDEQMQVIKAFIEFKNVNKVILTKLIDRIEIFENKKVKIHYKFTKP